MGKTVEDHQDKKKAYRYFLKDEVANVVNNQFLWSDKVGVCVMNCSTFYLNKKTI
jgi:hypothetical protein